MRLQVQFLALLSGLRIWNESEILSLYRVKTFDEALQSVRAHCEVASLTRSEKGAVVLSGDDVHAIDAVPVRTVVDTTGAGDAYAAGFLYAYTRDCDLATCGRLGCEMAAEIISHYGARPEADVKAIAARVLSGRTTRAGSTPSAG